jgi:hypothetical protein
VLCGGKACCPELLITEVGKVEITDDDGNKVLIDKDQAKLITEAIDQLEKKKEE